MQKFLRPILVAAFALALFTAPAVAQVSSFGGASSGGGSSFPLTANVSAAGYKIQSLGAGAASGDALSYAQTSAILDGLGLDGTAVDFDALDLNSTAAGANPWHFYSSGTTTGAAWGAGGFGISKSTTNLFGIEASGAIVTGTSNTQITNAAGTLRAAALDNGARPLGVTSDGGFNAVGSLNLAAVGTPGAPTVTVNTTGSTSYTYYCVALDLNGLNNLAGGLGNTLPSSGQTVTNGAATPNNTITCPGRAGALGFIVLKNATNAALGSCATGGSGLSCPVTDTGQATTSYAPAANDTTGVLGSSVFRTPYSQSVAVFGSIDRSGVDLVIATGADGSMQLEIGNGLLLQGSNISFVPGGARFNWDGSEVQILGTLEQDNNYAVAQLPACTSAISGDKGFVNNNDAACSLGAAPAHSSCTVGSTCYGCKVVCAEKSASYGWEIY